MTTPLNPSVRALGASVGFLLVGSIVACEPVRGPLSLDDAVASLDVGDFREHMAALSSDEMAGRRPGTTGYDSAAAYVIREARSLGLEPGGVSGSYEQPIAFRRARVDSSAAAFSVAGESLRYGFDFSLSPLVVSTETDLEAPLVFAGFGISAPDLGYDDFEGIEVEGKLVVVAGGAPDGFGSLERTVLSSSKARDSELRARGAAGVVVVELGEAMVSASTRARTGYVLPPGTNGAAQGEGSEELSASLAVPQRVAAAWMARAGRNLDEVLADIRSGEPNSFDLGAGARVRARYLHESFESANVIARLPGSDPERADEHLVVTAHLDHLGIGSPVEGDSVYNGTLDNASGSAALLTLASVLTRMDPSHRSILFVWVTAEESGLLGAEYFARFPTIAREQVVANQNIDGVMGMIAAASDVLAFGYEHSNLSDAVDFAVARTGTPVSPDPTPEENLFIRSDQYAFVRQGIPAIWVQAGRTAFRPGTDPQAELDAWIANRYHRPNDDDRQPMDREGIRMELENNLLVAHFIANEMGPIRWDTGSFLYRRQPRH